MYGYEFLHPDNSSLLVLWWRGFTIEFICPKPEHWDWGYKEIDTPVFKVKFIGFGPLFYFYWMWSISDSWEIK